jgi:hypothetical protein
VIERHGTLDEGIARERDEADAVSGKSFDQISDGKLGALETCGGNVIRVHTLGRIDHQQKVGPVPVQRLPLHSFLRARQGNEPHGDREAHRRDAQGSTGERGDRSRVDETRAQELGDRACRQALAPNAQDE